MDTIVSFAVIDAWDRITYESLVSFLGPFVPILVSCARTIPIPVRGLGILKASHPDEITTILKTIPETRRNMSGFRVLQSRREDILASKLPGTNFPCFQNNSALCQRHPSPIHGVPLTLGSRSLSNRPLSTSP